MTPRKPASQAREFGRLRWQPTIHRGDVFRVRNPNDDPKRTRAFVVVSRPEYLASRHSSAICAPIHTQRSGIKTEVDVGPAEGLKHASAIQCDLLTTISRGRLTDFIGSLGPTKLEELELALRIALDIE